METRDPVVLAQAALNRAAYLLRVLDREHTPAELYTHLRGVRHEVESAQVTLSVVTPVMVTRTRPETGLECIVVVALVDGELSGGPEPAPVES